MKKTQRILAWAGIILLAACVIFFLISAFFIKNPVYFKASLGCIIAIPIILYAFLMITKTLTPQKSALIDNIIFDVGNVLIDFEWENVMKNLGYSDETIDYLAKNMIHDPLWNQFDAGLRPYDSVTDEFCQRHPQYENEIRTFIAHMPDTIVPRSYTDSFVEMQFEDCCFPVPIEYDAYLRGIYGNYMELPPKDKQITHHSFNAWWKE